MNSTVNNLIEHYVVEADLFDALGEPDSAEIGARMKLTACVLKEFRDTLMAVARNQGGMASHQAQEVLTKTGHCSHFNSVCRAGPGPNESGGSWICHDCKKESGERLMPFE